MLPKGAGSLLSIYFVTEPKTGKKWQKSLQKYFRFSAMTEVSIHHFVNLTYTCSIAVQKRKIIMVTLLFFFQIKTFDKEVPIFFFFFFFFDILWK